MAEFAPGTVLATRFELLRPLGAGGLAEVYAARDRVTGSEVAAKVLHAHLAEEPPIAERFRRELSITRELDHPGNRARLRSARARRPSLFHDGAPARRDAGATDQAWPLERGRSPSYRREACAAAQAAHRAGVVHRDLKPQNVFLLESGVVKLLDFGLARVAGWARLTAQSTVMERRGYMAPELLGGKGADARAESIRWGAILYEMLTGKRAFAGKRTPTRSCAGNAKERRRRGRRFHRSTERTMRWCGAPWIPILKAASSTPASSFASSVASPCPRRRLLRLQ